MMKLRFVNSDDTKQEWYLSWAHVPRVGDRVFLRTPPYSIVPKCWLVERVFWDGDGVVTLDVCIDA